MRSTSSGALDLAASLPRPHTCKPSGFCSPDGARDVSLLVNEVGRFGQTILGKADKTYEALWSAAWHFL